ncbi:dynein axonemal assembly factor 6 [Parasteatoda tepidariorum]|uniref:dynein axonemal assembly factor 6 n=1 Tax=Parasteatoda tepidariorum TaxID=114398 RepID=UPI00077FE4B2|nr:dynein axonemal assembly factor 6 [Parasteatoda tepidariorum]
MNGIVPCDLKNLMKLLNLEDNCLADEDESSSHYTPSSIISSSVSDSFDTSNQCSPQKFTDSYAQIENSKNIWSEEEVLDEIYDELVSKQTPSYELIYRQSVTADDIYLQLSNKNPGSNSCENLVFKIQLKDTTSIEEITLKITAHSLLCTTKIYYLNLELPKNVDPGKCSAKWDQSSCILIVTLFCEEERSINI